MAADRSRIGIATLAVVAMLVLAPGAAAIPIVDTGTPSLPAFQGAPASKHKIKDPTIAPQNPFMAANPNSNIHNDTWMTDAYQRKGPLGNSPRRDLGGKAALALRLDRLRQPGAAA